MNVSAADIPRSNVPKHEQQRRGSHDHKRQVAAEDGHLRQQRRRTLLHGRMHPTDPSHLRGRPGRDHHCPGLALHDQGARVTHAPPVTDRRSCACRVAVLRYGHRLPCEHGLVDVQVARLQQSDVRRQAVSGCKQDHVAGDKICSVDVLLATVAQHHRVRGEQVPDGLQRALGLAFLDETHQRGDWCSKRSPEE
jgi:hypothetical protein